MKRLCFGKSEKTKRGVASLYIVIFATILFGVVTLSFMRIILSEAEQSSDDDLSRSAYDSAMAGVEDAKTAVNRYYTCLNGGGNYDSCSKSGVLFQDNCNDNIGLARYLYDYTEGEVKIQQNAVGSEANNNSDQAYTCVIISDTVPDYRGTLTSDTRTKVIPLGVYDGTNSSALSDVKSIAFRWFSTLNAGEINDSSLQLGDKVTLPPRDGSQTIPPTMSLSLVRMPSNVSPEYFHTANNGADYSTMILLPSSIGNGTSIDYSKIAQAGNVNQGDHDPIPVSCTTQQDFACSVTLSGLSFSNSDSAFLIASLPYGDTVTDFSVTLYKADGTNIELKGVQISVDSTGRTNDLVRRVETRLDPADLFFPYPQYEVTLDGGSDSEFWKKFWVTANCWSSKPGNNGGQPQTCQNYGQVND